MSELIAGSVDSLWRKALLRVLEAGEDVAPRGMKIREVRGLTLRLDDPGRNFIVNPTRCLSIPFAVAEWLWITYGRNDLETIAGYNKAMVKFSDDGKTLWGAYGQQIPRQLPLIVDKLKADPDSRQAVLQVWRPEALTQVTKDVPCTLSLQFFIRRGRLELFVVMRSNDLWLGFPYDVFTFTQTQRVVARLLGIPTGSYHHYAGSLHLYESNVVEAEAALRTPPAVMPATPEPDGMPPLWLEGMLANLPETSRLKRVEVSYARQFLEPPSCWAEYLGALLFRITGEVSDLRPGFLHVHNLQRLPTSFETTLRTTT